MTTHAIPPHRNALAALSCSQQWVTPGRRLQLDAPLMQPSSHYMHSLPTLSCSQQWPTPGRRLGEGCSLTPLSCNRPYLRALPALSYVQPAVANAWEKVAVGGDLGHLVRTTNAATGEDQLEMRLSGTQTEVEGGKRVALPNYTLKGARQVSLPGRDWWP